MYSRFLRFCLAAALACLAVSNAFAAPKIKVGYAKCAQCFSMIMLPEFMKNAEVEMIPFNSASDALTALMSKGIDVAQVTYLHYVTAVDRGFDVVAVSGHVNGGSDLIIPKDVDLKAGDWDGFKKMLAAYKAQGKPYRIATSRGSAQDLHTRGEMAVHGIDPNKDVTFLNVPNPSDHAAVLARKEVEMLGTVEPFASQLRLSGAGKSFAQPYDQAAGKLTGLIITRGDYIKENRPGVQEVVTGVYKLVEKISTDKTGWIDAIVKATGMDRNVATEALKNVFPDSNIYRKNTLAIGTMMKDLKYTGGNNGELEKRIDYSFLETATGKKKEALGF